MVKPKVKFIYSWPYDDIFKELYNQKGFDKEYGQYPKDR